MCNAYAYYHIRIPGSWLKLSPRAPDMPRTLNAQNPHESGPATDRIGAPAPVFSPSPNPALKNSSFSSCFLGSWVSYRPLVARMIVPQLVSTHLWQKWASGDPTLANGSISRTERSTRRTGTGAPHIRLRIIISPFFATHPKPFPVVSNSPLAFLSHQTK